MALAQPAAGEKSAQDDRAPRWRSWRRRMPSSARVEPWPELMAARPGKCRFQEFSVIAKMPAGLALSLDSRRIVARATSGHCAAATREVDGDGGRNGQEGRS